MFRSLLALPREVTGLDLLLDLVFVLEFAQQVKSVFLLLLSLGQLAGLEGSGAWRVSFFLFHSRKINFQFLRKVRAEHPHGSRLEFERRTFLDVLPESRRHSRRKSRHERVGLGLYNDTSESEVIVGHLAVSEAALWLSDLVRSCGG